MTFVDDREIELDADKTAELPQRVIEALVAISRFQSTDESILAWNPRKETFGRFYPAGYVEDLIDEIKTALTGEEPDAEASQD